MRIKMDSTPKTQYAFYPSIGIARGWDGWYLAFAFLCFRFAIRITTEKPKQKKNRKLRYYIFCIKWLWKNREWEDTRQKFKAMEKAYKQGE